MQLKFSHNVELNCGPSVGGTVVRGRWVSHGCPMCGGCSFSHTPRPESDVDLCLQAKLKTKVVDPTMLKANLFSLGVQVLTLCCLLFCFAV